MTTRVPWTPITWKDVTDWATEEGLLDCDPDLLTTDENTKIALTFSLHTGVPLEDIL
jgi:hypothetical protein